MQLSTLLEQIRPVDGAAFDACIARFDSVAKPVGSLGQLETLLARIAAAQRTAEPDFARRCVLVFCADNGVVAQGVAQSDADVTAAIARMMAAGKSSVCVMAAAAGAQVFPVDVGMRDTVEGLLPRKLAPGTGDIALGPAMDRETALAAIALGAELVREKKEAGYRLIATGEAGIGNTTTAAAMACVLLDRPPQELTGRGAGLSDLGLARKKEAITRAIACNRPDPRDPLDVLAKVGGLDIAAMTGVFLGGAAWGVPVVMDGVISAVAALCAVRLAPLTRDYILPSHMSAEPTGELLCRALELEPVLRAGMRLGEGTGAAALFPLLDLAAAVYTRAATFSDIAVEAYKRNPC